MPGSPGGEGVTYPLKQAALGREQDPQGEVRFHVAGAGGESRETEGTMRPVTLTIPLFQRQITPKDRALTCLQLARELIVGAQDGEPPIRGAGAIHDAWLAVVRAIEAVERER